MAKTVKNKVVASNPDELVKYSLGERAVFYAQYNVLDNGEGSVSLKTSMTGVVSTGSCQYNLDGAIHEIYDNTVEEEVFLQQLGDERWFCSTFNGLKNAWITLLQAIEKQDHSTGDDIMLALRCAASEFYRDGNYTTIEKFEEIKSSQSDEEEVLPCLRCAANYPNHLYRSGMQEDDGKMENRFNA
ncbi:hypothetical protein FQA39_LY19166 [Lamprigera yunnana]|nr:hypothetical protein FQA39_LY19166 [Lamprigera yunnana]